MKEDCPLSPTLGGEKEARRNRGSRTLGHYGGSGGDLSAKKDSLPWKDSVVSPGVVRRFLFLGASRSSLRGLGGRNKAGSMNQAVLIRH